MNNHFASLPVVETYRGVRIKQTPNGNFAFEVGGYTMGRLSLADARHAIDVYMAQAAQVTGGRVR